MSSSMCLNTEIRKLKPVELYTLGNILMVSDSWKKLMASVPKQENIPKFSSEHIDMIEQAAHQCNCSPAEIFIDEWSTMGKKRPTLGMLLDLLLKAELFRAADYIACDILKQESPKRPDYGPIASIDTSDAALNQILLEQQMLPKNIFAESLMLDSAIEQETNKICHNDKTVNNLQETVNRHFKNISNENLNYRKSVDVVSPGILSDLMKFSVTDTLEKVDKQVPCILTSAPEDQLPIPVVNEKTISNTANQFSVTGRYFQYEEVTSKELPIFLNDTIQPITYNEEMASEQLPVFLNNSEQSTTVYNEEMSLSDIPLCLNR